LAPAFSPGKAIPAQYAYKRQNLSPELRIGNVPANAKSLVVIVDDPDAPMGLWTHWLVWNLPANTTDIPEGKLPPNAVQGKNSFGNVRYDGPAPPFGTHRYFFCVYALDTVIALPAGSSRSALEAAMKGHVVAEGETSGVYSADSKLVWCSLGAILKGLESLSPGLTRQRLPWVGFNRCPTLKELKQTLSEPCLFVLQPLQGCSEMESTQGGRCYTKPGLSDHNPIGVEATMFVLRSAPPQWGVEFTL